MADKEKCGSEEKECKPGSPSMVGSVAFEGLMRIVHETDGYAQDKTALTHKLICGATRQIEATVRLPERGLRTTKAMPVTRSVGVVSNAKRGFNLLAGRAGVGGV
jgi:hypothetical protein